MPLSRAVQRPGQPDPPVVADRSDFSNDRRRVCFSKPKFGRSEVDFRFLESDQTDSIDPKDFWHYLVDPVRSRPFSSRSRSEFAGSSQDLAENDLDSAGSGETSKILARFWLFSSWFSPFSGFSIPTNLPVNGLIRSIRLL